MASNLGMSNLGSTTFVENTEHAAAAVDQSMMEDRNYLDLSDLLQVVKHDQPSVSGLLDLDYPSLADPRIGLSSVNELGSVRKIPLPAELVEQFGHMQCNCMMGLFPEISRGWLTIDSDVFVWNYEDGSDLAYFDGLSETILSAGLVKPKPGIFQPHIQYLLCLATPVDIVLLGVSFTTPYEGQARAAGLQRYGEMHLLPEPLFSLPTDSAHVVNIAGADNGRIFLACKDGCLYELHYQAEDGWFSRKCRKINHSKGTLSFFVPKVISSFSLSEDDPLVQITIDNSRNTLYTRSENGTIQVYDLGEDGKGMSRVAAASQKTTLQNAMMICRTIDRSNFKPIVHIACIPKGESANVHLVAVTHTGVRLYFTTRCFGSNQSGPSMLSLVHVRLPPGFSARAVAQRPNKVHAAHYKKGTLLLAASQSEDNDLLWTVTADAFPFKKQLQETHETVPVDGRTWAIAEVTHTLPGPHNLDLPSLGDYGRADPPTVVTQHMEPERKFVVINSQGSYLLSKLSPSDQLRNLLLTAGPDSEEVESYFRLHKEQACATSLTLACAQSAVDQQISEMSSRAFFRYGGEAKYNYDAHGMGGGMGAGHGPYVNTTMGMTSFAGVPQTPAPGIPMQASTPYPQVAQHLSFQSPGGPSMMNQTQGPEVLFSDRYRGLCLYLARLMRPLWEWRMVAEMQVNTPQGPTTYLSSRFTSDDISWLLNRLNDLKEFVDTNSQFATALMAEGMTAAQRATPMGRGGALDEQTRRRYQAEAEAQENAALKQLQQLLANICEALGLWKILCDHQFHVITKGLSKDHQNGMRNLAFRQFVTAGREISQSLITSLINMYLDDNAATDAISARLREVCPTLYSSEDQIYSKGNERLKAAKTAQTAADRQRELHDALERYKAIAVHVDLPTVCRQFAAVRYYRGVVDLALTAAARRDPHDHALHYYEMGEPPEDSEGMYAYSRRMDCYKCLTETLDFLLSTSMAHPQAPSVPRSPGPPPPQDPNRLTNTEADKYAEEVFTLALQSDDQLFHVALYEWLISKNLSEKLLEIQSPFLESYLKRSAQQQPDHIPMLDLLWKYYEKARNFSAASRILAKLADRRGTDLSLQKRMEYLSRATMCAKGCTQTTRSATEGEFLHELEEKMEVARLQLQLHDALKRLPRREDVAEGLERLNSELVNITTLYGEYAERFDLSECKLAILHCAGHNDPSLVEALWQDVIEKELTSSNSMDKSTRMKTLANKMIALGRVYAATDRYLPLAFLVRYLERRSCELGFDRVDVQFVFTIMLDISIPLPRLQEIYDRLIKSKDTCWKALRKPFHLLFVTHQLLSKFTESPTLVPVYEKRHFSNTALDALANYLVDLQAESSTEEAVRTLIAYFRDLQAKLERLV